MPNWSPTRKVFSSINKDIKALPFQEVRELYNAAEEELLESIQADLDYRYDETIAKMYDDYSRENEAPYEGNFSDQFSRPIAKASVHDLARLTTERIKSEFIEKYGIPNHIDWIMPQIVTLLGSMRTSVGEDGLISGKRFRQDNFDTDWLKGIYRFIMINTKSTYLKLQYKAPAKSYGSLVPLILYAQRLTKGTLYSRWSPDELTSVVHSDLAEAMTYEVPEISDELLIQFRNEGLTTKSGATAGQMKSAVSTHKLTGIKDQAWNEIPNLVQVMLTQIWMAHPSNRTKYMVLDPRDWDIMPPSLVSDNVLIVRPNQVEVAKTTAERW